jgi:acyl transferase domain-containing protein/NADPH:quinone reductase-like Zn-dependent oxidoreductase/NAD(P)-dependent dehydrogenase (short-subunit alcohol dehydrogenase family)
VTTPADRPTQLSPLKQALLALDAMQAKLDAQAQARSEPIAVIGLGCRFPGGETPEDYWRLVRDGVEAVREVPAERWDVEKLFDANPDAPGRTYTRRAGFLSRVDHFDPQFFGISPREAAAIDPQQRLLLEVAWEALEHAGQAPDRLVASRTGVFVGINSFDYASLQVKAVDLSGIGAYYGTGIAHSVASGRIAYVLGLQGPTLSVDTACSSSLVAVHLACQSLHADECVMALAGGVNLVLSPENGISYAKARMLAPDGRCKAFDAAADGFVDGEGCGIVVLKRLSHARADGDRVLAVLRGSAINEDGASNGLTAPNGPAQEAVIREALARAGLAPAHVDYVEAHGTGTSLGDPMEVQALGAVLGRGRPADRPLLIGSVKANIGHAEAAAGVAGLIKILLALQHEALPPQINFERPSPHIAWEEMAVRVVRELTPWRSGTRRRAAGVSSFGFGGTNAHVVVGDAPTASPTAPTGGVERGAHLLTLSAHGERTLRELAGRWARHLEAEPELSLGDVAFSANVGRARLPHRAAVRASSLDEARAALAALAAGETGSGLTRGRPSGADAPRVAFLFTGQGAQYAGMGRDLYETQPVFRRALDRCAELASAELDRPLLPVLFGDAEAAAWLGQTAYTQPALFALEWALLELWRSWGITPGAVLGHSVGEYAAAVAAGVLELEEALRLVVTRGRLMQTLPAGGTMAAVFAPEAQVTALMAAHADRVAIAAVNGPEHVVISGAADAVHATVERLQAERIKIQPLTVSHAFHSPLMEPILDRFASVASTLRVGRPQIAWVSNVTGCVIGGTDVIDGAYWRRHLRQPVRFGDGVRALWELGNRLFVEIGPGSTLAGMGRGAAPAGAGAWLPSLRRGRGDWSQILDTLAELWVRGVDVDWPGFERPYARRKVALPTSPFERARYWLAPLPPAPRPTATGRSAGHPLLGRRLRSALRPVQFEAELGAQTPAYLDGHRVHGIAVLPGTAFVEMMLAAGARALGVARCGASDVTIQQALILPEDTTQSVQVIVGASLDGVASCEVWSLAGDEDLPDAWRLHATAKVRSLASEIGTPTGALAEIRARCGEAMSADAVYGRLQSVGIEHRGAFRGLTAAWRRDGEAVAQIRLPEGVDSEGYGVHPALLDGCMQTIAAALLEVSASYLPVAVERVEPHAAPGRQCWGHVRVRPGAVPGGALVADVRALDDAGAVLLALDGVRLVPADSQVLRHLGAGRVRDMLYTLKWELVPLATAEPAADLFPVAGALAAVAAPEIARAEMRHGLAAYDAFVPALEALATDYVTTALARLGWSPRLGDRVTVDALAERLGILPRYRRLLGRFVEILGEIGVLRAQPDGWTVASPLPASAPDRRLETLRQAHPEASAELTLTSRCGRALGEVLTGGADPLALLFPDGSTETAEAIYTASPPARACGDVVAASVSALCARLAPERRLRVLEVGAGTGSTTAAVLPVLPADRTDYLFTDVSPAFTSRAAVRFRDLGFVRTRPLDLERDPIEQGLEARSFDLVIAANVVHATRDIRRTLTHCLRLLAPGGILLLLEVTAKQRWVDVTFGLTDGWWHFTDGDLRRDYPVLAPGGWRGALAGVGVEETATVPVRAPAAGTFAANTVILASAPRSMPGLPWLVVADEVGLGAGVAATLERRREPVVLAAPGSACTRIDAGRWSIRSDAREDVARVLAEGSGEGGWRGVVHCRALDAPEGERGATLDAQRASCGSLLALTQALVGDGTAAVPRLIVVTRGAQATGTGPVAVAQAPVVGLTRTIALEHPELRVRSIDVDPADGPAAADVVVHELLAGDGESEIAYRSGLRSAPRLVRLAAEPRSETDQAFRVENGAPGTLDGLALRRTERRAPGPGEVEIEVRATGLNFRDVLNALGLYPGDAGPLGSECAGVISAVGSGVHGLSADMPVIAIAAGSFATHVTTRADLVVPKPVDWSFEEAAAVPIAFVTAWYCLRTAANLRAGERVLIHAAAGGVGLAAVQVARALGAEVFATAGTPVKRAHVEALGVATVLDSRAATFADTILARTDGQGVDVVLNSLTGEAIAESVRALAAGGRFVEIGKRGVWTAADVARQRPGAAYHVIDLGEVMADSPAEIRAVLLQVLEALRRGELAPLPRRAFALERVSEAFRHMAQARHIGKVVVGVPATRRRGLTPVRPDVTYLLTGGLGGLGLEVARWLAEGGARALALVGRRAPSPAAEAVVQRLRDDGVKVTVIPADVSRPSEIARLLDEVRGTMPPLAGVFHAAGGLDDALLAQQDWSRFARVMGTKVEGAWALHALTREDALDTFVLFSSAASVLGSPGQGNHAAASHYLDALAHARQAAGLPALSVNWGAWGAVGAVASAERERRVQLQGLGMMTPTEGLAALEAALESGRPQVMAAVVDWERLRSRRAVDGARSLLAELLAAGPVAAPASGPGLRQRLTEAPETRRAPLLAGHVAARVARVLGIEHDGTLDARRPLNEMGLDSLMAVELRNLLRADLELEAPLSATLVFDHPSVEAIAEHLICGVLALSPTDAPVAAGPSEAPPVDAIDRIEQLSDEEVDRLFAARLRESNG